MSSVVNFDALLFVCKMYTDIWCVLFAQERRRRYVKNLYSVTCLYVRVNAYTDSDISACYSYLSSAGSVFLQGPTYVYVGMFIHE